MTKDDVLFGYRLQLFAEAARTNVSAACRTFGVHRSTYYAWKRQVDRHGLEMLRPRGHAPPTQLIVVASRVPSWFRPPRESVPSRCELNRSLHHS